MFGTVLGLVWVDQHSADGVLGVLIEGRRRTGAARLRLRRRTAAGARLGVGQTPVTAVMVVVVAGLAVIRRIHRRSPSHWSAAMWSFQQREGQVLRRLRDSSQKFAFILPQKPQHG
jgi:hypothetical protein